MLKHELLSKIEHLALKLGECELLWIYVVSDWIAIYVLSTHCSLHTVSKIRPFFYIIINLSAILKTSPPLFSEFQRIYCVV